MAGLKISQLTSSLAPSLTGVTAVVLDDKTYKSTLQTLRQVLVDSGSHTFTGSQVINGSLVVSGSITAQQYILSSSITNLVIQNVFAESKFGNHLSDKHDFTGSVRITGSLMSTNVSAKDYLYVSGFAVIGEPIHHTGSEKETLHVGSSGSINIGHFQGNNQHYAQVNIINIKSGSLASSDLSITADNGNETVHYVNLGINSSTYNGGFVGYENDAYLLNVGKDLYIGTVGGTSHPSKLMLFAQNNWVDPQMTIHTGSQITFNTSSFTDGYTYEFSGSAKLQNDVLIDGNLTIGSVDEKIVLEVSGGTSTYEFDYNSGSIFYLTSSLSNNVYNISNIPTENNKATSITFVIKQESTPYIASSYKINNQNVTVNWANNESPIGNANKTDVIGLTALRVGSSWNILGTFTTFG